MDNNLAERVLRGPVIGRRLSFGSDSETGARFTAMMYSVIGTLSLNGIDVLRWLQAWLAACAANGGHGYQPLMRRALIRFAEAEMKLVVRDHIANQPPAHAFESEEEGSRRTTTG